MSAASIVVIGDLHLKAGHPRHSARLASFDQIIEDGCARAALAAWVVLGDCFDARSGVDDRNLLADRLQRMADRAPVLLVRGNHDVPGDLLVFGKIGARFPIVVREQPSTVSVRTPTGHQLTAFLLPYPVEAQLVRAGIAPGDIPMAAKAALDGIFLQGASDLALARTRGELTLFAGHVNVGGSQSSNGQPNIGHEIELDGGLLARLGDCPKLLGHIHLPQDIAGAIYVGSVAATNWGELEAKRFVTVEWQQTPGVPLERAWSVESHPLKTEPLYHVEGVLRRDGFTWEVAAEPGGARLDPPVSWRGCEVRVRVLFNPAEAQLLEMAKAQVFANFAEAARFELEMVAMPVRELRAPAVAVAQTLLEKLSAYAEASGSTVSAHALGLGAELEHADAATFVAGVQARMETLVQAPATPVDAEAVA